MVFDLGGGTFDVTIAEVIGKKVKIINSEGNPHLGGKDFDRKLLEIGKEEIHKWYWEMEEILVHNYKHFYNEFINELPQRQSPKID